MNTTKKLPQAKHDQWTVLCKEQSESGLTVRQWCEQNGYTIHTYNYWKHRLKESYVDSVLPDIVPIIPQAPAPLHELCDLRNSTDSCINNTISVLLCGVTLSLDASASERCSAVSSRLSVMLRDADPSSFSAIYVVCGYTDMRYGMDTFAAIIETRYHLPLFVPNTLFLFCGRRVS